jgi:hypothetical protein
MSTYWNFREILQVEPKTDTCVGYANSKSRRCANKPSDPNRRLAGELLDAMDRMETVLPSDFSKLAEAMLCRCKHNCKTMPSHNKMDKVCEDWRIEFENYQAREKEKSAKLTAGHDFSQQPDEAIAMSEDFHAPNHTYKESRIEVSPRKPHRSMGL